MQTLERNKWIVKEIFYFIIYSYKETKQQTATERQCRFLYIFACAVPFTFVASGWFCYTINIFHITKAWKDYTNDSVSLGGLLVSVVLPKFHHPSFSCPTGTAGTSPTKRFANIFQMLYVKKGNFLQLGNQISSGLQQQSFITRVLYAPITHNTQLHTYKPHTHTQTTHTWLKTLRNRSAVLMNGFTTLIRPPMLPLNVKSCHLSF